MAGLKGLVDKARQMVGKNPDKARQGVDRAAGFVDEKTGGKYSDKIDKAQNKAHDQIGEDPNQEQRKGESPPQP